jgi:hypothetical protein
LHLASAGGVRLGRRHRSDSEAQYYQRHEELGTTDPSHGTTPFTGLICYRFKFLRQCGQRRTVDLY